MHTYLLLWRNNKAYREKYDTCTRYYLFLKLTAVFHGLKLFYIFRKLKKYALDCQQISIALFTQTKMIVADNFLISGEDDKYRIRVDFNSTDFLNPIVRDYFHKLNGQRLTTRDQDNDKYYR